MKIISGGQYGAEKLCPMKLVNMVWVISLAIAASHVDLLA